MGCVVSKNTAPVTPVFESAEVSGSLDWSPEILNSTMRNRIEVDQSESGESAKLSSNGVNSQSFRLGNFYKHVEGEQVAAGWPSWLSVVARRPYKVGFHSKLSRLRSWRSGRRKLELPEKYALELEELRKKIGQGAYSSVFRARYIETGKFVALKKARLDHFDPASVRFMAREIFILRRLNHPNIKKLEGLITSRSSCSIYLVFEYMEHDLAGLSSSPDISFSESQVKYYMHQLLSGLEHCHSRGVLHRDIKSANLLINNEGILKIADFGLSNFYTLSHRQWLTSRVVTLWYRPPELLLGATQYEPTIDLWSVGCVFAEVLLKKPILQGRTEVEQIHKIFKLCGSPPAEYWKRSRLPNEALFKPHQAYESCLKDTFRFLPHNAYKLLETFLSIEPQKRGTAAAALSSEYFRLKPYACDPLSLPKYPPNKEIDSKIREELLRLKFSSKMHPAETTTRPSRSKRSQRSKISSKLSGVEEAWLKAENTQRCVGKQNLARVNDETGLFVDMHHKAANHPEYGYLREKPTSRLDRFSAPIPSAASKGFKWAKKQREDWTTMRSQSKSSSKVDPPLGKLDLTDVFQLKNSLNPHGRAKGYVLGFHTNYTLEKPCKVEKDLMVQQWVQHGHPEPYAVLDYQSHESTDMYYYKDAFSFKPLDMDYKKQEDQAEYSLPLLNKSLKVDELLEKHEQQIHQVVHRSRFQKDNI